MMKRSAGPDRRRKGWVALAALLVTLGGTAHAASEAGKASAPSWASAPEQIAVTGIITSIADENLRVSYGMGELTVSMAGWDWRQDGAQKTPPPLSVGENVTVTGAVDAALFDRRILRAQSVFVQDRQSYFTATAREVTRSPWSLRGMPISALYGRDPVTVRLAGEVVTVGQDEFSIEVGSLLVTISTASMTYNPLDEIGRQQIRSGDWVQVGGKLSNRLFEDRRLDAKRITSIYRMDVHAM